MEDGSFQKQLSAGLGLGCLFTPASVPLEKPLIHDVSIFGWSLPQLSYNFLDWWRHHLPVAHFLGGAKGQKLHLSVH